MSEKRPETDADIITRSKPVRAATLGSRGAVGRRYRLDLSGHMAECDANYHRLLQLFPHLHPSKSSESALKQNQHQVALHLAIGESQVVFEVLERGPYTTLLNVAMRADKDGIPDWQSLTPSMVIRVYHDAQSAEVVSYQNQRRFHAVYDYPNWRMRQPDEKVQINRFLSEFLTVCLAHGASVDPVGF